MWELVDIMGWYESLSRIFSGAKVELILEQMPTTLVETISYSSWHSIFKYLNYRVVHPSNWAKDPDSTVSDSVSNLLLVKYSYMIFTGCPPPFETKGIPKYGQTVQRFKYFPISERISRSSTDFQYFDTQTRHGDVWHCGLKRKDITVSADYWKITKFLVISICCDYRQ